MRSSISNFRLGAGRGGNVPVILGIFVATFMVMVVLGEILLRQLPPNEAWKGAVPGPPPDCPSLANEALSDHSAPYDLLYYGIGDMAGNARKADVLLLGNSRVLFAFHDEVVRAFHRATGIRVFNLSFLSRDGMDMAMDTIRRQGLSPAIVVVNEDGFFSSGIGPYGRDTVAKGYWRARMDLLEDGLSWSVRSRLHRWLPRFGWWGNFSPIPYVYYQCRDSGCLALDNFPAVQIPFHPASRVEEEQPTAEETGLALDFKNEMERRGTQVVFTNIPFGVDSVEEAQRLSSGVFHRFQAPDDIKSYHLALPLARRLGVPLVAPSFPEIMTFDGNHLDRDSADLFAYEFFKEFLKLPCVKTLRARKAAE